LLCAAGAFAPAAFVFYASAGIAPGVNPKSVVRLRQIACLCLADNFTSDWKRSRLRQSRAGRQMTAEVRKLAKGPHMILLLNFTW